MKFCLLFCYDFVVKLANKLVIIFQLILVSDTLKTILDSKAVKSYQNYILRSMLTVLLCHDDAIALLQA